MSPIRTLTWIACAGAPSEIVTSAHPHTHSYTRPHVAGSSVNLVIDEGDPPYAHISVSLAANFVMEAMCLDAIPFIRTIPVVPPEIVFDGDTETSVSGACIPFETVYGDDTSLALDAKLFEEETRAPVFWLARVDMNGDGSCSDMTGGDLLDFCTRRTGPIGSVSITYGDGLCSMFVDGSAAIPALQVLMFGAVDTSQGSTGSVNPAVHGSITLI